MKILPSVADILAGGLVCNNRDDDDDDFDERELCNSAGNVKSVARIPFVASQHRTELMRQQHSAGDGGGGSLTLRTACVNARASIFHTHIYICTFYCLGTREAEVSYEKKKEKRKNFPFVIRRESPFS